MSRTLSLKDYYESHNLNLESLVSAKAPHRFIRLNPRFDDGETLRLLEREIRECLATGASASGPEGPPVLANAQLIRPVPWLDVRLKFYAVPSTFNLSQSPCFRQGRVYGQDASSGAAVAALLTPHFDDDARVPEEASTVPPMKGGAEPGPIRVLDLCCCPGLKLCAMADLLRQHQHPLATTQLVGVDVSEARLATCRQVLHKYQVCDSGDDPTIHIQLYCHDGTKLVTDDSEEDARTERPRLVFDSRVAREQLKHLGKRKRQNKSSRAREHKLLHSVLQEQRHSTFEAESFDYVLVDAECSTDGSIRHVRHRLDKTDHPDVDNPLLTDPQQLADLVSLQKKLATAGFRLLKPGGSMVYSTCSLSREQNEGVVEWLLRENPDATFVPVRVANASPPSDGREGGDATANVVRQDRSCASHWLPGSIRFVPMAAQLDGVHTTSRHSLYGEGFFLAKIAKQQANSTLKTNNA